MARHKADSKRTYGFIINKPRQYSFGHNEGFIISVVTRNPGEEYPINGSSHGESASFGESPAKVDGFYLQGLQVNVRKYDDGQAYWNVAEYGESYSIDAKKAEQMNRTLRAIGNQVTKDSAYNEIGDYVTALASALGATWYAVPDDESYSSYPSTTWRFRSIPELKQEVRRLFTKLKEGEKA